MTRRSVFTIGALLVAMITAGCASTQGLSTQASLADAGHLAARETLLGVDTSNAAWPSADWWTAFNDPQLNQLIDEALRDSPSLRIAAARTRKALAFADVSNAAMSPQINASYSSTRQLISEHGAIPPPLAGTWDTLNQLQGTLNWDLDFWGRNRAAYDSALGEAKATEVDAHAARLALSVSIAQAYVQLERAYLQLDVAENMLKQREQIFSLTRERNSVGLDTRIDLNQAESALPATREQIIRLNEVLQLTRNEIAALMGQGPDRGNAIQRPNAVISGPITLPSTLPAELLGRRPDLIASRLRAEAAQKNIAVAKAEFYPNVNLLAFVGFQGLGASDFLTAGSRMAGVGPAVSLPIFDGGRLRANLAGKYADYDIAAEQYNQALANAMRDVADQVVAFRSIEQQGAEQKMALATAQEAYDLARLRFREGIGNYLQVLSAESALLAQQSLDIDLRTRQLQVSINLTRALGGGFSTTPSAPLASVN